MLKYTQIHRPVTTHYWDNYVYMFGFGDSVELLECVLPSNHVTATITEQIYGFLSHPLMEYYDKTVEIIIMY